MPANKGYLITDEGDGYEVTFLVDGVQVGSALFPQDGNGMAKGHANAVATSWTEGGKE